MHTPTSAITGKSRSKRKCHGGQYHIIPPAAGPGILWLVPTLPGRAIIKGRHDAFGSISPSKPSRYSRSEFEDVDISNADTDDMGCPG